VALDQATHPFPFVVTDLVMPDGSGLEVLAAAKRRSSTTEVVVMTAHQTIEAAIEATRGGAYDFVTKPFSPSEMVVRLQKALEKSAITEENQRLKAQLERFEPSELDFGQSPRMQAVAELVEKAAKTRATVLVTGESGTGKERVARALHARSDRSTAPFLVVNCGALPEALMESELFGHEKGAFTGAAARTQGIFREADGGTVLLDEVGELPLPLQVKLLRVLQERKVRPVGGAAEVPVDVRVLAATNRDVEASVREGQLRQDLYYRLNVIRIEIPPLRERKEDVARLAERFARRFADEMGKELRGIAPDALRALDRYAFPGNVRELENMMERAVALASSNVLGLGDLPAEVAGHGSAPTPSLVSLPEGGCELDEVLGEVERRLIVEALERTGGVRMQAAKLLGITFRSLRYRLQKLGLANDDGEGDDELTVPASSTDAARDSPRRETSPGGRSR
jgi:two-component system response regulator PilR (NtrC family)